MRFLALLFLILLVPALALAGTSEGQWQTFVQSPTKMNYRLLAVELEDCKSNKCALEKVPSLEIIDRLASLVAQENNRAIHMAFLSHSVWEVSAAGREYMLYALGSLADSDPRLLLKLVAQYHLSDSYLEDMVGWLSEDLIDDDPGQQRAIRNRIQSLSRVKDENLARIRNKAIAALKADLKLNSQ